MRVKRARYSIQNLE